MATLNEIIAHLQAEERKKKRAVELYERQKRYEEERARLRKERELEK